MWITCYQQPLLDIYIYISQSHRLNINPWWPVLVINRKPLPLVSAWIPSGRHGLRARRSMWRRGRWTINVTAPWALWRRSTISAPLAGFLRQNRWKKIFGTHGQKSKTWEHQWEIWEHQWNIWKKWKKYENVGRSVSNMSAWDNWANVWNIVGKIYEQLNLEIVRKAWIWWLDLTGNLRWKLGGQNCLRIVGLRTRAQGLLLFSRMSMFALLLLLIPLQFFRSPVLTKNRQIGAVFTFFEALGTKKHRKYQSFSALEPKTTVFTMRFAFGIAKSGYLRCCLTSASKNTGIYMYLRNFHQFSTFCKKYFFHAKGTKTL